MNATRDRNLWEQILLADEINQAYFAVQTRLPGVSLFCAERPDAPEFDVALIYRVPTTEADATLRAIVSFFQERGRSPRIRLSPLSAPMNWARRLRRAGFAETDERLVYFSVPETVRLATNPAVGVERIVSRVDADRFSAIQVVGFDIPPEHRDWDRELVHRHLAAGRHAFYLARFDERGVGAARSIHLPGGVTGMAALATLPEARGRGVGTSLLARMVADARVAGSSLIFGTVISNSYAAGMYQRLGFMRLFRTWTYAADSRPGVIGAADVTR
jgi:ribosomal-protein-alanine N-acetyltransferase